MAGGEAEPTGPHGPLSCYIWYANYSTSSYVLYCPGVWDTVLCWPPTEAGTTAVQRCPKSKGIDDTKYAYKTCRPDGVWQGRVLGDQGSPWGWTNYSTCVKPDLLKSMKKMYGMYVEAYKDRISVSLSGWTVEQVGLSFSLIALLVSFFIFYKSRCGRGKEVRVHRNLFGAMLAQVLLRLLIYMDRALNVGDMELLPSPLQLWNTPILCEICYTLLEYSRTSMFLWLLMDAYVTHSHVTETALNRKLGYRTSLAIGWGSSAVITTVWLVTTLVKHSTQRCLRGYTSTPYFWIQFGPRICFIFMTFALLINAIRLIITKHKHSQSEDVEKSRRAAKMELIVLPLLSVSDVFLVATTSLPRSLWQLQLWVYSYRILRGCQGLFLSLAYCLLRKEVYGSVWQWAGHYLVSRQYERARHEDSQLCEAGETSSLGPPETPTETWRTKLAKMLRR
uniref:Pigment dispersing factor receptor isoform X1 n=1 Tax=Carausius morosus TaxID=7022 RepID=A0A891XIR7_CARMO|nr:pigment dispersing factor receptor isoform X1 [Carausius morosus]